MTTPRESVFGDDIGGVGKQTAGEPIPGIGETPDSAVAQDTPAATADGQPVSPSLAARRYGANAGYGSDRGTT
jgi:hypothetical protein